MDQHHRSLSAYALRQVGRREAAADVVQEVFLRLCRADRQEVEPHLAQWLFTVCRRLVIDVRRKDGRMTQISLQSAEPWSAEAGPVAAAEQADSLGRAVDLMSALRPNQQEVLRLKFQHSLTYREIAGVTGLSERNVGFLIQQCCRRTRRLPRGRGRSICRRLGRVLDWD